MKKLLLLTAVLTTTGFGVAWAGGPGDSVHGGGQVSPLTGGECENHLALNLRSGPGGEDPQGTLHYTGADCGHFFKAEVVCLRVVANRASVVARFVNTKDLSPIYDGGGVVAFYEDNGNPQQGQSQDRQQNLRLTAPQFQAQAAAGCPPPIEPRAQLDRGNLIIGDG